MHLPPPTVPLPPNPLPLVHALTYQFLLPYAIQPPPRLLFLLPPANMVLILPTDWFPGFLLSFMSSGMCSTRQRGVGTAWNGDDTFVGPYSLR